MRTSSTGNRGFTLVEVCVVMVRVAIAAGMTIPRLASGSGTRKLASSARGILLTMQYARDYATTRRLACRLRIDPEGRRYGLEYEKDPQRRPGEFVPLPHSLGKAQTLESPIRFERVRIEPTWKHLADEKIVAIRFDLSGQTDAAIVEITDGEEVFSLLLNPCTGRVELIKGKVENPAADRVDLDA